MIPNAVSAVERQLDITVSATQDEAGPQCEEGSQACETTGGQLPAGVGLAGGRRQRQRVRRGLSR